MQTAPPDPNKALNEYRHQARWWQFLLAAAGIIAIGLAAYWRLLHAPESALYPYGSDSWCHVFKAEFLAQQMRQGNYFPQFYPFWHEGVQPFRYWAPLTYSIIAAISLHTHNVFRAVAYYITICSILGGLSWLIYYRRMGLWPAAMGGALWVIWCDNLTVYFLSGNYPRTLTIAILPIMLYCFTLLIEETRWRFYFILIMVLAHIVVLCHPMVAATYCVGLMIYAIIYWFLGGVEFLSIVRGAVALTTGLITASWWLLPSLTEGGAGFSTSAMGANADFLPMWKAMNPFVRTADYWGISMIVVFLLMYFTWSKRSTWTKSLFICGTIFLFMNNPIFQPIHSLLPLSSYLWPIRFSTFWSMVLILSGLSFAAPAVKLPGIKRQVPAVIVAGLIFAVVAADCAVSVNVLARTVSPPKYLNDVLKELPKHPGWRVAALDLARFGAVPSYWFSTKSDREQVFGWAWQGAKTAENVMLLNEAIEKRWYPYLFHRLDIMGSTDIVVFNSKIKAKMTFRNLAHRAGYRPIILDQRIDYWHKQDVGHYFVKHEKRALAIGRAATIYSLLYPEVEAASSGDLNDYTLSDLKPYHTVILTSVTWSSRHQAETLIKKYAMGGGKVIVDLTGFPADLLSGEPKFFGVYGESVTFSRPITAITYTDETIPLEPFAQPAWRFLAPQCLDGQFVEFNCYGSRAALIGFKYAAPDVPIYFLGGNIAYHVFLTHDANAQKLLKKYLGLSPAYIKPEIIPMQSYSWSKLGYKMTYRIDQDTDVIVPVAALEGFKTYLDGKPLPAGRYENHPIVRLPRGEHTFSLVLKDTPIYIIGRYLSILTLVAALAALYISFRTTPVTVDLRKLVDYPHDTH